MRRVRVFETGATRDADHDKPDYIGFMDPLVIVRFGEYMMKHRIQPDGEVRDSDNWKKGIDRDSYIRSGARHLVDWWLEHEGYQSRDGLEDALCGVIFNASGYLRELLRSRRGLRIVPVHAAPGRPDESHQGVGGGAVVRRDMVGKEVRRPREGAGRGGKKGGR